MNMRIMIIALLSVILLSASCTKDQDYDDFMQSEIPDSKIKSSNQSKEKGDSTNGLISLFADNSIPHQSAASFGDYLFLVTKSHTNLYMYSMKQKTLLFDIEMEPGVGTTYYGTDMYHCNQMSFGVSFYDPLDPFPLLYISQRSKENLRCFTEVYRIIANRNSTDEEFSSLSVQLVQTIYFPPMSIDNSMGNVNCVIDSENKLLYTYSRNNNEDDANYRMCKISCFNIPELAQTEVYLEDNDILNSFMLNYSAYNMQGGCIKDNILYIGQGYSSAGYIYLNVIDLEKQKSLMRVDLFDMGIRWEPEGVFWHENKLFISSNDTNIWETNFSKDTTDIRTPKI